jgi:hypothetical protein
VKRNESQKSFLRFTGRCSCFAGIHLWHNSKDFEKTSRTARAPAAAKIEKRQMGDSKGGADYSTGEYGQEEEVPRTVAHVWLKGLQGCRAAIDLQFTDDRVQNRSEHGHCRLN